MNTTYKSVKEIIPEVIAGIEKNSKNSGMFTGIPTGFGVLDKITDGFQPSNLIVIGSRPGLGKTSFALSLAANMVNDYTPPVQRVIGRRIPTAWFSPDMSNTNLIEQLISIFSAIEINKIRSGFLTAADFGKLKNAADLVILHGRFAELKDI
jgi:replicative DNA helicase